MPFTMPFTSPDGGSFPNSYWRVVQFNIGAVALNSDITYYGYDDSTYPALGKPPIDGAVKTYKPSGNVLAEIMGGPMPPGTFTSPLALISAMVDSYALSTLDTPNTANPPANVSFFGSATQVA